MPNLRKWSTTATGNATVAGGATTINWAEQQLASTVNNTAREMMAQVRSVYTPAQWGWIEHSSTASVASQTAFKLAADVTADYTQGRRVRLSGGSTTRYGDIVSSSFTAETTITLKVDSGSLSASHSIAALSAVYDKNLNTGFLIKKETNEDVNNSTTFQNDDELFFAVAANTDYEFEFTIIAAITAGAASGMKWRLTGPAAPTIIAYFHETLAPDSTTVATDSQIAFSVSTNVGTATTKEQAKIKITGVLHNGANSGTVQLQWAQQTAVATNTTVRKGSTLRYSVIP